MEVVLVLFTIICLPLVILCVPIAIVAASILANGLAKRWFELKHKELELRRWEAERRYDQVRMIQSMPPWLDPTNAVDVAAWRAAMTETAKITAVS
jgi:hypothetical protein